MARSASARWLVLAIPLLLVPAVAGAGDEEALRARIAELERRCASAPAAATAWQQPESWQRLERGMTRFRVFELLGEPGKVAQYDGFERWEYPDFMGGRVNFDDGGRVKGWRAPH